MLFLSALLGAVASILLVIHPMIHLSCPYERVAYYLTVLASDVVISILSYALLPHIIFLTISVFLLAQVMCWGLMNHRNMVHFQVGD